MRLTMLQLFRCRAHAALEDRRGTSALEYAILAGVRPSVISAGVASFKTSITDRFAAASSSLSAADIAKTTGG